jgi:hypothetical protein
MSKKQRSKKKRSKKQRPKNQTSEEQTPKQQSSEEQSSEEETSERQKPKRRASKRQILESKDAQTVAMTNEEIRILGDAISEIGDEIEKANEAEKQKLEIMRAELRVQQILNRSRQNAAMDRLERNYGNNMSADEISQQLSRNERNSKNVSVSSYANQLLNLAVNSVVKTQTIDYDRKYENISNQVDLLMADINKLGKTAVEAAKLQANAYTSAIDSSLSNLIDGINEGAYASASNLIDLSAQSKNFSLEQVKLNLETKNTKNVREAQNTTNLKNLDAQETQAWANIWGEGVKLAGKAASETSFLGTSFGKSSEAGGEFIGNGIEGLAAINTTITELEGKLYNQKFENEKTITEAQLNYNQEVQKEWIQAAANVQKAFLNLAQHVEGALTKAEAAANDMGINLGFSGKQLDTFKRSMFQTQITIAKWGKTMEDAQKMQNEYTETTGRNIQFTTTDFDSSFAFDKLVGQDGLSNKLTAGMELFNHSVSDSNEMFFEMYKNVSKIGLNSRKYFKDLQSNLRLAEKYQFKGGVKSLMEMSKWAQNVRFNMGSLDNILDKVQTGGLEGIIEQSAKLQVLGGNYAMGADPLAMAYEAFNDPDALAKRLNKMLVGEGVFNSKTGEVDFSGFSQMKVRAMAEATGQDYKDVLNQARQMIKGNIVNKELNGKYKWSDEDKALITNKARLVNGEWKVTMDNNVDQSVSTLSPQDLDHLKPTDNEEKLVNYVANIRDMMTRLTGTQQENIAKLQNDGFEQWMQEEQTRIQNVATEFNDNYQKYLDIFSLNMKLATDSQKTMLSLFEQGNSNIDSAQQDILNEGKNISSTLSKVNTLISTSFTEMKKQIAETLHVTAMIRGEEKPNKNDMFKEDAKATEEQVELIKKYYKKEGKEPNFSTKKGEWFDGYWEFEDSSFPNLNAFINTHPELKKQLIELGRKEKDPFVIGNDPNKPKIDPWYMTIVKNLGRNAFTPSNVLPNSVADIAITRMRDGVVSQNGQITKIDNNDQVLAAKKDGPIDKMLNTVSSFNNPDTLSSPVSPRPMSYNSQVMESPHRSQSQSGGNGKLEVAPIQININGSIKVNGNGGSTDITRELANNPEFVRSIAQIISIEVEKKVQGGRVVDPINRGLVY